MYITVTQRSWVTIKLLMIFFIAICFYFLGYKNGTDRLEVAQQFGHDAALLEYPIIQLEQSGVTFCYENGNIYKAKNVTARKGRAPLFKAEVQ